jgi:hypothetical protein
MKFRTLRRKMTGSNEPQQKNYHDSLVDSRRLEKRGNFQERARMASNGPSAIASRLSELGHACKGEKVQHPEVSGDLTVSLRQRRPPTRII